MSTPITYGIDAIPATRTEGEPKAASLGRRILDQLIAAREAQARRYLADYLSAMSDARLTELGYSSEQIRQMRTGRRLPEFRNG